MSHEQVDRVRPAASAVSGAGYTVVDAESRSTGFTVNGMDCADEVRQIEAKLGQLPGVTTLRFDLVRRRLVVEGSVPSAEVERALAQLGMQARHDGDEPEPSDSWRQRARFWGTMSSGILLAAALALDWAGAGGPASLAFLALSIVAGGWFIVPRGARAAWNRAMDMNFLMSIAAMGAVLIGEWAEAASVLFLFSLAQLLETYSMDRVRNAIAALMDLSPAEATVLRGGRETRVPIGEVAVGENVLVRPGEKVPVDGEVVSGISSVNQAPITGESMPVDKQPGAEVFTGTLNGHGALRIRCDRLASDTTLARIVHAVEEAQASRAPSQSFVDAFARIYTPAVVLLAVAIILFPPLLGLGSWSTWIYRGLAMLVVACPCALVISTPVSIVSGLTAAARAGVLVKGGAHLERAGQVTTVAFDKTGTLTEGRPVVTDVLALEGAPEAEVVRMAMGVERQSEHPLAQAILSYGKERGLELPESEDFQALPGRGARANVRGVVVSVGSERLAGELGVGSPGAREAMERFERGGKTAILVASGGTAVGVIAIADRVRPDAAGAIAALRELGVQRLVLLTGDNAVTARAVAEALGLDGAYAELLPEDKVRIVRELEMAGERVAFVGDGINDAPALATATVGVAMGVAGSDVALETADIALMSDDLEKLPFAIRLARATLRIIRQNIAFSIAVKALFVVLAVAGWATLWMAVAADMGASLVVIANGLRTLRTTTGVSARDARPGSFMK